MSTTPPPSPPQDPTAEDCPDPCDPVLEASLKVATDPSTTPEEKAAVLEAAGLRTADVLNSEGKRKASVLQTAGQRRINLTWEITQAIIAVLVATTTLSVCAYIVVFSPRPDNGAFMFLSNIFFLVIGTYFQRTNHVKMGGVPGPHEER